MSDLDTISTLLRAHRGGDRDALDRLMPLVYDDLHRLARRQLAGDSGRARTLDTTGLVHEAYLRLAESTRAAEILAVDQALAGLGALDPLLPQIVECRFFAGLTEEETAEALGLPLRTVQRDWSRARAWLKRALGGPPPAGDASPAGGAPR